MVKRTSVEPFGMVPEFLVKRYQVGPPRGNLSLPVKVNPQPTMYSIQSFTVGIVIRLIEETQ